MRSLMSDSNGNSNGSSGQDTLIGPIVSSADIQAKLFEAHKSLLKGIWDTWKQHKLPDQVKYTRISIVSLTQAAAVCAVDVGMTEENFLATCKANYAQAVKSAPRWG